MLSFSYLVLFQESLTVLSLLHFHICVRLFHWFWKKKPFGILIAIALDLYNLESIVILTILCHVYKHGLSFHLFKWSFIFLTMFCDFQCISLALPLPNFFLSILFYAIMNGISFSVSFLDCSLSCIEVRLIYFVYWSCIFLTLVISLILLVLDSFWFSVYKFTLFLSCDFYFINYFCLLLFQ